MAKRELVDFQLYRQNGDLVGDRISTSLDPNDPADVADFHRRIVGRDWDVQNPDPKEYKIRVWRHNSEEELLTYP